MPLSSVDNIMVLRILRGLFVAANKGRMVKPLIREAASPYDQAVVECDVLIVKSI